ncbi:hypothetical protein [Agromyces aerolatus]|uniref:hypothetical protein n=1 Tax=Agromyces sp. LY-1074 TaxID=3074080 RepID=UPI0028638CC6|nr:MULTISPECIES: hypothetical protein [unclassified Agromyces]MDR5699685.1 hypothetical protein [Agromyces sp. LY-1074]MDR5705981.1 hypothetical protein [Agromyces sp. LY-1358]
MVDDALAEVADELYGLPPDEFTAARNARARRLKIDDRVLAKTVSELRRPSPAAWLVNQLVRHRADQLDELLQLGAQLQAAQADLDAASLTALARERRKVVSALARDAGRLADELGNPVRGAVLDEVAETLQAGMTDASAADAVRSGCLVRGLEAIGTEVDLEGAVAGGIEARAGAGRSTSRRAAPAPDEVGARRARKRQEEHESEREREARERAEREEAERERAERARAERRAAEAEERAVTAERAAAEASDRLDEAHEGADRAAAARDDLETQLRDLESRLAAAERRLADAERAVRPLEREHDRAARAAEEARSAADELRAELD